MVAYAQPLIDQTDGSMEQMQKALSLSQLCFNLALSPAESREKMICDIQPSLEMDDEEFADFRRSIVDPMIRRHEEMFPLMHQRILAESSPIGASRWLPERMAAPAEAFPGTDRYAPCPCNSGKKYKFCCGAKGR
jgi:hypothetical protein